MSGYQHYRGYCNRCGKGLPKRELNKILISYGHSSIVSPKIAGYMCDDCLPVLFDTLGVPEPERKIKWGKARKYCKNCFHDVGKSALYCSHCGEKLNKESEVQEDD